MYAYTVYIDDFKSVWHFIATMCSKSFHDQNWPYILYKLEFTASWCQNITICSKSFVIRNGPIFRIWEDANGDTSAPHIWKHSEDTQLYYAHYSQADGAVKVCLMCFFLSATVRFLGGCHMCILSDICILSRPFFHHVYKCRCKLFYTLFNSIYMAAATF